MEHVNTRRHLNYPKADWTLFYKCLNNSIHAVLSVGSLSKRLETFCNLLKGPSQRRSPSGQSAKESDLRTNRKQCLEMNHEITTLTEESKRATWHRHRIGFPNLKMPSKLGLLCAPYLVGSLTPLESLYCTKLVHAIDLTKASAFVQEYAKISGRQSDKESRKVVNSLRCLKRSTCTTPRQQIEEAYTPRELKAGKAAGPDGTAPDLKHLSSKGSSVLLNILSSSWRSACVVLLLKKGKDPADMGGYRSIALTSTIRKVMERFIANRLLWWLDEHSALSPWQAGFRKGLSTTDHCLRLMDFCEADTIAIIFNISRAYDRVWRTGLLMSIPKMGAPRPFTGWLSSWLIERTARVRENISIGPSKTFKEGQAQGSVHYPPLFTIYIDDLQAKIEKNTFVSVYADRLQCRRQTTWTVRKRPGNPTSSLMENECSAIHSWFSWVTDTTSSSPLQSMCENSANRCPVVSTISVLWVA